MTQTFDQVFKKTYAAQTALPAGSLVFYNGWQYFVVRKSWSGLVKIAPQLNGAGAFDVHIDHIKVS